jgi:leucyl-tRNA synthetase
MILANEFESQSSLTAESYEIFLKLLSPMAPHLSEELYSLTTGSKKKKSIFLSGWPKYNRSFIEEDSFLLIVQINGKVRDKIESKAGLTEEKAKKLTFQSQRVKKWIGGKEIKKVIFVPGKLINIVI